MGYHYLPQAYLTGFTEPQSRERIWVYDKAQKKFFCSNIEKVAQENGYWASETEIALNSEIESPANPVLEKLRRYEPIDSGERYLLSVYIAVMLARVPRRRDRILKGLPAVLEETVQEYINVINQAAAAAKISPALAQKRLSELDEIRERYRREPPKAVLDYIRLPSPNEKLVHLIYSMVWRFLIADKGRLRFLASDNPAFFFESFGFGQQAAELSFPISSRLCLLGNWQGGNGAEALLSWPEHYVKEMNRRNASTAARFLFYHERADWLATLAHKNRAYLSRIQWQP
jgi:hypothetical protein